MREFQQAEAVMLVREVDGADGATFPGCGEVLDEGVVAAGVAPALDAPDVGAQFAGAGVFVRPDVAVAFDAVGACVGVRGTGVEGGGAIDGFFEGGGDAREAGDVLAEFGADGGFAVARGDGGEEIGDEGVVVRGVVVWCQTWGPGGGRA